MEDLKEKKYFLKVLEGYLRRLDELDNAMIPAYRIMKHLKEDIALTAQNLKNRIHCAEKIKKG